MIGTLPGSSTPLLDTLTREVLEMPDFDLDRLVGGLPITWGGLLVDWDRSLRAGNYPATTR